jgi:hypothetical protein
MTISTTYPRVVDQGVHFRVAAGFAQRDCVISKNALAYLARSRGQECDFMETYSAYEDKIHSVARRLVLAGESASPLVLGAAYFVDTSLSTAS